jgi:hypothetical protein
MSRAKSRSAAELTTPPRASTIAEGANDRKGEAANSIDEAHGLRLARLKALARTARHVF